MKALLLAVLLLFAASARASQVEIIDPVKVVINAQDALLPDRAVDLGVIGPGQKLELIAYTDTGEISRGNETISSKNADWDRMEVLADSLPRNWVGTDSLRYESPMKAFVVVNRNAADGDYNFLLITIDEFEGVSPLTFRAKAQVTSDVFSLRIAGEPVKVPSRAAAVYQLELENRGSASDVFEVKVAGLPRELEAKQTFFVPHNSKVTVDFLVQAPETGEFLLEFTGTSLSSDRISSSAPATLFVGTSLLTDLKAASRGVLLFPGAEQLAYAVLGFASGVFQQQR